MMENLPTRLCLRNKNLHCFRACLRTPPRTVKYQVVSLRDLKRSSLEYIRPCIQKKTMLSWKARCWILKQANLITANSENRVSAWQRESGVLRSGWEAGLDRHAIAEIILRIHRRDVRDSMPFSTWLHELPWKKTQNCSALATQLPLLCISTKENVTIIKSMKENIWPLALLGLRKCSPRHLKFLGYSSGSSPCAGGASGGPMRSK